MKSFVNNFLTTVATFKENHYTPDEFVDALGAPSMDALQTGLRSGKAPMKQKPCYGQLTGMSSVSNWVSGIRIKDMSISGMAGPIRARKPMAIRCFASRNSQSSSTSFSKYSASAASNVEALALPMSI